MLEKLILTENAYFYKKHTVFPENFIVTLHEKVKMEKELLDFNFSQINQIETIGEKTINYSALIFNFKTTPTFISTSEEGMFEIKYCFLIIVEYLDYIIVSKKNISGLNELYKYVEELDYNLISRIFVDDETLFQKMSMKNMDISESSLRNKVLESNDIKQSISSFGANKYIINYMRLNNRESKVALSLSTSRINQLGEKCTLKDLFLWVVKVADKIEEYTHSSTYLDMFAIPIDFSLYRNRIKPTAILIGLSNILSDVETHVIEKIIYRYGEYEKNISMKKFHEITNYFKGYFEIEQIGEINRIKNLFDNTLGVKLNKKSITIQGRKIGNVILKYSETEEITLLEYINRKHNFIVTFDEPEIIYYSRKLFKDGRLLSNIESFLSVFIPNRILSNKNSEKGNFSSTMTEFEDNSLFSFIEKELNQDALYLFCDDLGNEWADYVSVKENAICFYHAKSKDEALSASNFQDVVGQALKNLGNFIPQDEVWSSKENKWKELYNNDSKRTRINRVRKGDNVENGIKEYRKRIYMPNVKKQVHLVINFISKQKLNENLYRLKETGNCENKNSVVQILWFISSLISACNELGIEIYIHCCE